MTRFHLYAKRQWGNEHVTSLLAETEELAKDEVVKDLLWGNYEVFDKGYFLSTSSDLDESLSGY